MSKQRKKHPGVVGREKIYKARRRYAHDWNCVHEPRWRAKRSWLRKRKMQNLYIVLGGSFVVQGDGLPFCTKEQLDILEEQNDA